MVCEILFHFMPQMNETGLTSELINQAIEIIFVLFCLSNYDFIMIYF